MINFVIKMSEAEDATGNMPANVDSDASLDSDGYDKNDPYAATAKKIDKRIKLENELKESKINQISDTIIRNKDNITFFEKNMAQGKSLKKHIDKLYESLTQI